MNNKDRNTTDVIDRPQTNTGEPLREVFGQAGDAMARAAGSVKESLENLGQKLGGVRDRVSDKSKEYWRNTDGYVGRNPWVAVGISAGVAFLAGMLIGRRRNE
jgi:ElaB/YqjD/DUF883 family membrane-anchored ribosome-binding protein